MTRDRGVLLLLGLALLGAILSIARLGDLGHRAKTMVLYWGVAHAAYLAAVWWVLRRDWWHGGRSVATSALPIVLVVGLLARALLIPSAPTLSEDVYRYLWDGRLVAHGVNPFPHAPADRALAPWRNDLVHRLNHADVPTIYPPAAQLLFAVTASVSETPAAWKLLLLALETLLVLSLLQLLRSRGLRPDRLLLYYWNPLVLVESFGSGHLDLAAAAFLVVALYFYERRGAVRGGIALGLSVLVKYVPGLLLPWLVRRRAWGMLAVTTVVAAVLFAPFVGAGSTLWTGLEIYARHWEFNGLADHLLRVAFSSELAIRRLLAGAGLLATLAVAWRARSATGAALACLVSFLLLSPTVFPWYLVPVVALLPLHPDWGLTIFSGLVALSYLPLPAYRETGVWSLPSWILWAEYGGLTGVWGVTAAASFLEARRLSGRRARVNEGEDPHV